jgi:phage shock protein PspC (stress-responsive transcriptional regulator)
MTDTTHVAAHRLERPRDAAFKGVSAALARYTATDVVLWRVLFVVLIFFGGLGVVLYLVGMVAIPREGEERSIADRLVHGPDRHLPRGQLVLVVVLVIALLVLLGHRDGLVAVLVLGALAFVWWRGRDEPRPVPYGGAAAAPVGSGPAPPTADAAVPGPGVGVPAWMPPDRQPRPRSPLGGLTASLAAVVAGVLLLVGASGAASVPAEVVLAAALLTVGLGLVAGAFLGRSPGLVGLALLLGLVLAGVAGARPAIDAGIGDRTWRPVTSGSYRLGVGDATLDLRDVSLPATGTLDVDARVDVGHLLVLVPDGLRVSLDARAQLGDVQVLGEDHSGRRVHQHVDLGPAGAPQLRLALSVRTGQVEVRRG